MSKNKSRKMQHAVRVLNQFLEIDSDDPHALPGSSVHHVKEAKKILQKDIRKRLDGRNREQFKRGS
jgi:hypothetical protein